MKKSRYFRSIALVLAAYMLFFTVQPVVQAAMISTTDLVTERQISMDRQSLIAALDRDDVRLALTRRGVDTNMAKERIASLTDEEVALMKQRMDEMPAGGSAAGVLLVVFLVLLFTDLMGWTDIFPFVKKK